MPVQVSTSVEWKLELSQVLPDPPLETRLKVSPMPGGFLVDGTVRVLARHTCYRCLDEWDETVISEITQFVVDDSGDEDADYSITEFNLDLEPILRDELLLTFPVSPICSSECKGVVDTVQTDLNGDIPGDEGDTSSPFSALKGLLDTGD